MDGDAGSFEQVLMNLVVNARDAMQDGGRIVVRTGTAAFEEGRAGFPGTRPGDYVVLTVEYAGCGMDETTRSRLFEPFFTTKGEGKGTGLGLSVVYGIVQRHGGWINVYSELERGSTFRVYLPCASDAAVEEFERALPLDQLRGSDDRLLVVEDEQAVRQFLTEALRQAGYDVVVAAGADEAEDAFDAASEPFSGVISDVVLVGQSGVALADRLRAKQAGLPVLFVTGYAANGLSEKTERVLPKPFSLRQLLEEVRNMLRQRV